MIIVCGKWKCGTGRRKDELDQAKPRPQPRKVLTEKWPQLDLAHNKPTNKSGELQRYFFKTSKE